MAAAGAQFVVTPGSGGVRSPRRRGAGFPVAAGAFTPTEAYTAMRMGASVVKLFPAAVGGPAYLKAVRDPFPDIPFVAVGGVRPGDVPGVLRRRGDRVGPAVKPGGTLRRHHL